MLKMLLTTDDWEFKLDSMGPFASMNELQLMFKIAPKSAPSLTALSDWILSNGMTPGA